MSVEKQTKVLFIKGRPDAHPIHAAFANSIGAHHIYEDFILRWHNIPTASKLKRYTSWVLSALFMPKKYDIYFTECVRIPLLLMKKMGLMKKHQKLIALMADESLYFLYAKRYPRITQKLMYAFFKNADALICIGQLQTELAQKILPTAHHRKIFTIFNGIPIQSYHSLKDIQPNLKTNKIIVIGDMSAEFRVWYKGMDIMLSVFDRYLSFNPEAELIVLGGKDVELINKYTANYSTTTLKRVHFVGKVPIQPYLQEAALCLHLSRGDAFPTSTLESLLAGVPTLVSDLTGTKNFVEKVSEKFVINTDDIAQIADRLNWYFSLSYQKKLLYSQKSKEIGLSCSEEKSITNFIQVFQTAINNV